MFAELDRLQEALRVYINANYHLSHPDLVARRDALLTQPGALRQRPFIESTPRYQSAAPFAELSWLPTAPRELLTTLAEAGVIYPRPYTHQAEALEHALVHGRDLVITTGTGSGKTETFLLPVLGRLAREAAETPDLFKTRAVRALVLYPMNALVNDQLGRMRGLFGGPEVSGWFQERAGRPLKFARYTGKTLYPGHRRDGSKHREKLRQLELFVKLEEEARDPDPEIHGPARALIMELQRIGKWPAKPSDTGAFDGFTRWYGRSGQHWSGRTREDLALDPELLIRHEVQENPPDLLITNYSMLEYMLLRPIERDIFRKTRGYFEAHRGQTFTLVLDESHLYRGATGAEIGMLVRRLRARLGLNASQLHIISTSASFTDPEAAKRFIAGLSGKPVDGFEVLTGELAKHTPTGPGEEDIAAALAAVDVEATRAGPLHRRAQALLPLFRDTQPTGLPVVIQGDEGSNTRIKVRGLDSDLQVQEEEIVVSRGQGLGAALFTALDSAEPMSDKEVGALKIGFTGEPPQATLAADGLEFPPGLGPLCRILWDALASQPVVGELINRTSGDAQDLDALPSDLFPGVTAELARMAVNTLLELCPAARGREDNRPLLAARVHLFLRGLPGLWACVDPDCAELDIPEGERPCGRLYSEPLRRCGCGARVFELYSCRSCGAAFLNAWADDPASPSYLWLEDVGDIEGMRPSPISIALQEPESHRGAQRGRVADLEMTAGKLYTEHACDAERVREVWLAKAGESWSARGMEQLGRFSSCPCCGAGGSRYPIQDHTTSGDDPFMEVTREQLMLQPPRPESTTPLRGRKVLIFSDGRQLASRLSGKLMDAALRDSARPLLLDGLQALSAAYKRPTPLSWAYLAVLTSCLLRGVEPRPKQAPWIVEDLERVERDLFVGGVLDPGRLEVARELLERLNSERVNEALMGVLLPILDDPYTGLAALGLADIQPILDDRLRSRLRELPAPSGGVWAAFNTEDAVREALLHLWLQLMLDRRALWLPTAPVKWRDNDEGPRVSGQKASFKDVLHSLLPRGFHAAQLTMTQGGVKKPWLRFLFDTFGRAEDQKGFLLNPARVTVATKGALWGRCERCSGVQPLIDKLRRPCFKRWGGKGVCGGELRPLSPGPNPVSEEERIFRARKGLYRLPYERLQSDGEPPHPFSSAPHTAALNASGEGKSMGLAELYELRFQDIPVPDEDTSGTKRALPPIDVLSVTTTMEVGIDIGSLTAVAMRNVPPGRANYQQRAGRAGRRGSSLSLVATWCGADSHDQQFFNEPAYMVSGDVPDPKLSIHNPVIIRRHLYAALFSEFQLDRVEDPEPGEEVNANVFESLGALSAFREGDEDEFSFRGMSQWMEEEREALTDLLVDLLPDGFIEGPAERRRFAEATPTELLKALAAAGAAPDDDASEEPDETSERDDISTLQAKVDELKTKRAQIEALGGMEAVIGTIQEKLQKLKDQLENLREELGPASNGDEEDEASTTGGSSDPDATADERKLLDRLFARGVLPRYAFPTSVVALHVFDTQRSTQREAVLEHAPQRDLNQALSSYAPGREVWINGERHYSFAIWSPFSKDRYKAWAGRRLYLECDACGYAELRSLRECSVNDRDDCKACGKANGLGPATYWIRPPGFAHPHKLGRALPSGASPAPTRPTRAKLRASFEQESPQDTLSGVSAWTSTENLVVTNTGANERGGRHGFKYCTWCGLAEPNSWDMAFLNAAHYRPNPDHRGDGETCTHRPSVVTLGNEFRTDVAVLRFDAGKDIDLPPKSATFRVVMKTLAVALTKAAVRILDIEPSDISGEHRLSLAAGSPQPEVFLYDVAAGGAGFVKEAAADLQRLLTEALRVLEGCSNEECTSSCYQCLRSYKNKWDHGDLDRLLAAAFLRCCVSGDVPRLDERVEESLLKALAAELADADADVDADDLIRDGHLWLPAQGRAVILSHPLRPGLPGSARGDKARASIGGAPAAFVSQLVVERHLPLARKLALGLTEEEERWQLPVGVEEQSDGLPLFSLMAFEKSSEPEPESRLRHASLSTDTYTPDKYFFVRMDSAVMDRLAPKGALVLFRRTDALNLDLADQRYLVRRESPFGFPASRCTVGRLRPKRGGSKLTLFYDSQSPRARAETAADRSPSGGYDGLEVVAVARKVLRGGRLEPLMLSGGGS